MEKFGIFMVGIIVGICFAGFIHIIGTDNSKSASDIKNEELVNKWRKDSILIDSLKYEISKLDSVNYELYLKKNKVDSIFINKVESIKYLPLDSSVKLLQFNLKRYEEIYD